MSSATPTSSPGKKALRRTAAIALAAAIAAGTAAPAANAAPSAVSVSAISVSGTPKITGKPDVGTTLYLDVGKWSSGTSVAIQWFRDGKKLSNATGMVYRTTRADIGTRVHATITGNDGKSSKTISTAKTDKIGWPKLVNQSAPKLTGTTMDGYKLTVSNGSWDKSGITFTYQWYRDGHRLDGETSRTYALVRSDVGSAITARVTASRHESTSASATTAATAKIRAKSVLSKGSPSLKGSTQVGYTLRAAVGGWAPSDAKTSYQWLRNGKAINGATSSTYKLTRADLGKRISFKATGSKYGWSSDSVTSKQTSPVRAAAVSNKAAPVISGSRMDGFTLTASNGSWSPASVSIKYQWLRDGKVIKGATAKRYQLTKADVGKQISVKVTASAAAHKAATSTSAKTGKIASKKVRATSTPKISGKNQAGETLKAAAPQWSPKASTSYQWLRDGKEIFGASGDSYRLSKADVGKKISVKASGKLSGWATGTSTSPATGSIKAGTLKNVNAPSVRGKLQTFQTLFFMPGQWSEKPDSYDVQWKRSGKAISGATGSTYKLTAADAGHSITVTLKAKKAHWNSATATSTPSAKVRLSPIANNSKPEISGVTMHGTTLYAKPGSWNPSNVNYKYQWLRDGQPIAGQNGLIYRTSDADLGSRISLQTTVSKSGYESRKVTSAPTPVINFPPMVNTKSPAVKGSRYAGRTLSTTRGSWDIPASSTSIQWYRDGQAIKGATATRYTTQLSDSGHTIEARVKAAGPRRTPATAVSNSVKIEDARVLNSAAPVLTGRAMDGFTLTASNGVFSPSNASITLQWLRDGVPISGENGKRYTLRKADIGKRISVQATARKSGWISSSSTSNQTGVVAVKTVLNRSKPALSGRAMAGYALTATNGVWDPAQVSVSYQWLRDGQTIPGATSKQYTLRGADVGRRISVAVSASSPGWASKTATSNTTGKVADTKVLNKGAPAVSGSKHKGQMLTATEGSWSPSPSKVTFQWFRGGDMIPGATGRTYRSTGEDVGQKLTVRATAHAPGHDSSAKHSAAFGNIVHGALENKGLPSVSGKNEVFSTLTANEGSWSQTPGSYAYQWYRNGVAIPGKTAKTYKATQIDKGKQISVRVTARKANWSSASATSNKTGALDGAKLKNSSKPSVSGTMKPGYRIWADPGAWDPKNVAIKYQWYADGAKVPGATDLTFNLFQEYVGKKLSVEITASMYGYEPKTVRSDASATVKN